MAREILGQSGPPLLDALDGQRLGVVDEVDERVRAGRDDADVVALVRLLHLAEDPRKTILDVIEEALEVAGGAAHAQRLDAAGQMPASGRAFGTDGPSLGRREEVLEDHALEAPAAAELPERLAQRLPVVGEDIKVVRVLGHATAHAPDLLDRVVDAPQAAQRTRVPRPVGV